MRLLAVICLLSTVPCLLAEDASVRKVVKTSTTFYGYADAREKNPKAQGAEVWHIETGDGRTMLEVNLPPTASEQAKTATALAALRSTLGNSNATLRLPWVKP